MSAFSPVTIGPSSVRYAAQIRELLFAEALRRMVADQEAARTQLKAERAASLEAAAKAEASPQNAPTRPTVLEDVKPLEAVADTRQGAATTPARLVDIQV
ncbi:MAG: hypothetical protein ACOYMK_00020 [Hyphomonadaceae bacterium]|jgi:hypothetical protein